MFLLVQAREGGGHIEKKWFICFVDMKLKKYIFHHVQFNKIFLLLGKNSSFFDKQFLFFQHLKFVDTLNLLWSVKSYLFGQDHVLKKLYLLAN